MNWSQPWKETSISTASVSIKHAARILRAFDIEPQPADFLADKYFRGHREIHSRNRRAIADLVFNALRWRRRLIGILETSRPTPIQLMEACERWKLDIIDNSNTEDADRFPGGPAAYWSYPDFLYDLFVEDYGEELASAIMQGLNREAKLTIRVNATIASRGEVREELMREGIESEKTELSPYGLILKQRANLSSLDGFKLGKFEVQDEASQLASMLTGVKPGELVLDACAGGGGKSLFMAMMMKDRGTIIATDKDLGKIKKLGKRANRAQVTCIKSRRLDGLESYVGQCDAVVVDAPCSGTGTIRRSPDLKWRLSKEQIESYASFQLNLLREYSRWLKPDGRLIYITCSVLRKENEDVVSSFVRQNEHTVLSREFVFQSIEQLITREGFFKTLPIGGTMDGFFVSVMKRR